jgi:hypothetical protein
MNLSDLDEGFSDRSSIVQVKMRGPLIASGALAFTEDHRVFDPQQIYGDVPNPTQL